MDHVHHPRCDNTQSCHHDNHKTEAVGETQVTGTVEYTCPMHPEVVASEPGDCPICGMALEPSVASIDDEENTELVDMQRRFWVSLVFTIPLLVLSMGGLIPGISFQRLATPNGLALIELFLASPVVLWGAWPFFVRGWRSITTRNLNMFTLISLGVGVSYVYSITAALFPDRAYHSTRNNSWSTIDLLHPLR